MNRPTSLLSKALVFALATLTFKLASGAHETFAIGTIQTDEIGMYLKDHKSQERIYLLVEKVSKNNANHQVGSSNLDSKSDSDYESDVDCESDMEMCDPEQQKLLALLLQAQGSSKIIHLSLFVTREEGNLWIDWSKDYSITVI